jgi:predicted acylesterase/phospholipase RssA
MLTRNLLAPVEALAGDAAFLARNLMSRGMQFFRSKESVERRTLELVDLSALISNEPEVRLVDATIEPASVLASPKILKMAATNWDTGRLNVFTNHLGADRSETLMAEDMIPDAVLSSTAIPGVFPPVQIDGVHYVDGGLVMNTPLTPAVRAGADTLHLIYLDPSVADIPLAALQSTLDVMSRLLVIQFAANMNADIEAARRINRDLTAVEQFRRGQPAETDPAMPGTVDELVSQILGAKNRNFQRLLIHRYHPRDDVSGVLGLLNFGRDRIADLIERGYRDAVEHDCRVSQCVMPDGSYAS